MEDTLVKQEVIEILKPDKTIDPENNEVKDSVEVSYNEVPEGEDMLGQSPTDTIDSSNRLLIIGAGSLSSHLVAGLAMSSNIRIDIVDESDPMFMRNNPHLSTIWEKIKDNIGMLHSSVEDLDNLRDLIKSSYYNNVVIAHSVNDRHWIHDNPVNSNHRNIIYTSQVIDLLRRCDFNGRIIHISSWSVYGAQDKSAIPFKETLAPNPISMRGGSRLAQELIVKTMCKQYGIVYNILRPGSICGPYTDQSKFLNQFVKSALTHETILLHDGGKQTRDVVSINDVVWMVNRLVTLPAKDKGKVDNQIFNVGGNFRFNISANQLKSHELSVEHYANSVITLMRKMHSDETINTVVTKTDNPENKLRVFLDNKKAHELLGFAPDDRGPIGIISDVAYFIGYNVLGLSDDNMEVIRKTTKNVGEITADPTTHKLAPQTG